MSDAPVEVSIVLPCLNEEGTLAECIQRAKQALAGGNIDGEIIIADNGSTDRSAQIATDEGARLISVPVKGYGNALHHGFEAANGKYIIFLDADLSYDFAHIPRFVEQLRGGPDLVMGSRFKGTIHPGAMPPMHRYLGTPVLTRVANIFFRCGVSDVNCGMRGLTKDAFERMGLRAGGMEFASEMIIKAAKLNMRIEEIPTDLHPDKRGRPPHLRSFHDGWRHLRFMLLFCPTWLFTIPGVVLTSAGIAVIVAIMLNISPYVGMFTCLVALAMTVLGVQITLLGLATHGFAQLTRLRTRDSLLDRAMINLTLEKGVAIGSVLGTAGAAILIVAAVRIVDFMNLPGYDPGQLDLPSTKLALLGTALLVTGIQIVVSSFFLGLFSIESVDHNAGTALPLRLPARQAG